MHRSKQVNLVAQKLTKTTEVLKKLALRIKFQFFQSKFWWYRNFETLKMR